MKTKIDISLGIPAKDSSCFLPDLFASLKKQQVLPREIIFIDDCSSDNSAQLVNEWVQKHPELNAVLHKNSATLGIGGNYNRIIELSSSAWVQILDADDYVMNDFYSSLSPVLNKESDLLITGICSNSMFINTMNQCLNWTLPARLPEWLPVLGSFATRSGIIYKRDALKGHPFPDPAFNGSDIIHLVRLRKKHNCVYIRKAKVFYRIHAQASGNTETENSYLTMLKSESKYYPLYLVDHMLRRRVFHFLRKERNENL
jgi:glycosyltransferase involved in cell wall biosynthesis